VVVTDLSNGDAVVTFQAISVKNPSGKFSVGFDSPCRRRRIALVPRHAHQALAVRATDARRMVCAFGGTSNASVAVALGSVECAIVSQFGDLSAFANAAAAARDAGGVCGRRRDRRVRLHRRRPQRHGGQPCCAACTHSAADRGAGGQSRPRHRSGLRPPSLPVAPSAFTIMWSRPFMLRPTRLNPGGESLPSNLVRVKVPNVNGVSVRLEWASASLDGVVSYRVFRTASPDQLSVDVRLHATLSVSHVQRERLPLCRHWRRVDAAGGGARGPASTRALGHWATLAPLPAALMGVSLA
jgi:hypothetical protein